MNLKVSFSWVGLVVFALPMLINLAYAAFPPAGKAGSPTPVTRWVELIEQSSRIACQPRAGPPAGRLVLAGGLFSGLVLRRMDPLFSRRTGDRAAAARVPAGPAAAGLFPVLYYLCTALWLRNLPAVILMLIFGAAHLTVSTQSFSAPGA